MILNRKKGAKRLKRSAPVSLPEKVLFRQTSSRTALGLRAPVPRQGKPCTQFPYNGDQSICKQKKVLLTELWE